MTKPNLFGTLLPHKPGPAPQNTKSFFHVHVAFQRITPGAYHPYVASCTFRVRASYDSLGNPFKVVNVVYIEGPSSAVGISSNGRYLWLDSTW